MTEEQQLLIYIEHQKQLEEIRNRPIELQWGTLKIVLTSQGTINYYQYQKVRKKHERPALPMRQSSNPSGYRFFRCTLNDLYQKNYWYEGEVYWTTDTRELYTYINDKLSKISGYNYSMSYYPQNDTEEIYYDDYEWVEITKEEYLRAGKKSA